MKTAKQDQGPRVGLLTVEVTQVIQTEIHTGRRSIGQFVDKWIEDFHSNKSTDRDHFETPGDPVHGAISKLTIQLDIED